MVRKLFLSMLLFLIFVASSYGVEGVNVLFDEGHGQFFSSQKEGALHLSKFAKVLKDEGLQITVENTPFNEEQLKRFDAIIISGPFKPFTEEEISLLQSYVQRGGKLIVMLHISMPAVELFKKFGVEITKGPISETVNIINNKNTDFYVQNLSPHTLTHGLSKFAIYGTWGFIKNSSSVELLALSSPSSWIDTNKNGKPDDNEQKGPFGVIAIGTYGKGTFLFFADDAIFQNSFLEQENLQLAKNLAKFIKE